MPDDKKHEEKRASREDDAPSENGTEQPRLSHDPSSDLPEYKSKLDDASLGSPTALACWALFGFVFNVLGLIITWLIIRTQPKKVRDDAIWFCVIGCFAACFLGFLYMLITRQSLFELIPTGGISGGSDGSIW